MRVLRVDDGYPAWNAFVAAQAGASIFHLAQWRSIISRAYGHPTYYLVAEAGGTVRGVLPLALIRSRLFGRSLVSLPFADYGGICADDPAAVAALLNDALRLGGEARADYLQLRHREPVAGVSGVAGDKVTMLLPLEADARAVWGRLTSERRNRIKKAQAAGVRGRVIGVEGLDAFYRVLSENMRDIGSPVHSRTFFRAVLETLPEHARVLLVERDGEPIGAAMCLLFRDTLFVPWVSSLRRHFRANPNMILYWTAIEYGCAHGFRTLDFGRSSRDAGTFEFKRQWGAATIDLAWTSFPLNGAAVPTFSGQGLKERVFVECWKRLPLGLSATLGARVRGLIPA